jgi:hypothetical protein
MTAHEETLKVFKAVEMAEGLDESRRADIGERCGIRGSGAASRNLGGIRHEHRLPQSPGGGQTSCSR